jgi:hypothetical protein
MGPLHSGRRAYRRSMCFLIAAVGLLFVPPSDASEVDGGQLCQLAFAVPADPPTSAFTPVQQQPPMRPPETRGSGSPSNELLANDLLAPPREQEMKQLGSVLKALANPKTSGNTLTGLGEGRPFSLTRYSVLLGDVRAIVIHLQARELRARLAKFDGKAENAAWLNGRLGIMETCAPSRFDDRGGPIAFANAVNLVSKSRRDLQPFLFQSASQEGSGPQKGPSVGLQPTISEGRK